MAADASPIPGIGRSRRLRIAVPDLPLSLVPPGGLTPWQAPHAWVRSPQGVSHRGRAAAEPIWTAGANAVTATVDTRFPRNANAA